MAGSNVWEKSREYEQPKEEDSKGEAKVSNRPHLHLIENDKGDQDDISHVVAALESLFAAAKIALRIDEEDKYIEYAGDRFDLAEPEVRAQFVEIRNRLELNGFTVVRPPRGISDPDLYNPKYRTWENPALFLKQQEALAALSSDSVELPSILLQINSGNSIYAFNSDGEEVSLTKRIILAPDRSKSVVVSLVVKGKFIDFDLAGKRISPIEEHNETRDPKLELLAGLDIDADALPPLLLEVKLGKFIQACDDEHVPIRTLTKVQTGAGTSLSKKVSRDFGLPAGEEVYWMACREGSVVFDKNGTRIGIIVGPDNGATVISADFYANNHGSEAPKVFDVYDEGGRFKGYEKSGLAGEPRDVILKAFRDAELPKKASVQTML